ncbi:short-chain dehydrogenase/reductase SDR [Clostridium sp. DL-VIII]|uniref:SDR family NAD(P)-dependent oxidoreductase n=1 Tax=Clostridium sp. DL-VIII TaxID=641107 RepID=UPI00023AF686|nr:SDR family oxidoreductase [Clostridium sp. DL-VIII]EHI97382.1 short-chain dehydrogenase/reductase SDR [Clostridium sp. DL-VIII]
MKYVLITGGTSGIGLEFAKNFAKDGYNIVIVSSNNDRLQKTKQKLENEFGIHVLIYQQDMGKIGAAIQLYNKIKEDNLSISVLINNAGIGLVGPTDKINFEYDERMMILNIINLVELCKLYISDMYKFGEGRILNVSSTGAFMPGPYTSTYCASKAFVLSYSRAISYEAKKRGVQVSALCPGPTKTDFFVKEGTKTPQNSMTAETVVTYAYKQFMKNKDIIIPGFKNRITKLFPIKLKMNFIAKMKKGI